MNRTLILVVLLLIGHTSADAADLTGDVRDNFVESGIVTCVRSVKSQVAGVSDRWARQYCDCTMNKAADSLTTDELLHMKRTGDRPSSLDRKLKKAAADCV